MNDFSTKLIYFAEKIKSLIDKKSSRFEQYEKFYYKGSNVYAPIALKRLHGEINIIKSLIFTPERLIIRPIVVEDLTPLQKTFLDKIWQRVQDNFYTFFRLDKEIKEAVLQALIYGYCPVKVFWYGDGVLYKIIPVYNFGVLYESLDLEDRQQIILHISYMTKEKIKKEFDVDLEKVIAEIEMAKPKKEAKIMEIINITKEKALLEKELITEEEFWISENGEPLYQIWEIYFNELYYLDGKDRWHKIIYLPLTRQIIAQTPLSTYRHPFFIIRAIPLLHSIYGLSIVELIKDIQMQRIKCLSQIEELTELRTHPPFVVASQAVSKETIQEELAELHTPRGTLIIQDPNAQVKEHPPATGLSELYTKLDYWNEQLKFTTGLFEIIMGEAVKGGRATGEILATFASSIFRDMAHEIQSTLEQIFTFTAELFKLYCKDDIIIENHRYKFADFPYFVRFEIEGYSASPIKMRETKEIMLALYKMGDIPADILFKVFSLPFYEEYKEFQKTKTLAVATKLAEKAKEEEEK